MARIRSIKPEFWTSEQIVECSPITRLLFIGMWNFCDDAGNHPASFRTLKMEVFPGDDITVDEINDCVNQLIDNDLIVEYESCGKHYWHVTGWHHQKIERPNFRHPKFDDDSTTTRRTLDDDSTVSSRSLTPGREGKGIKKHMSDSDESDVSVPEKPKPEKPPNGYTPDFEKAWEMYPRTRGSSKKNAFKAWKARLREGIDVSVLMTGVERYSAAVSAERTDERYIKLPETFFGPGDHFLSEWTPNARGSPRLEPWEVP